MSEPKKLFIKTYGCQMNVYDSERMAEALGGKGYVETKVQEEADMILLNTCHIREKAAEKVYSELGRLRQLRQQRGERNGDMLIGVAGCVAQAEGAKRNMPPTRAGRLPTRPRDAGRTGCETGIPRVSQALTPTKVSATELIREIRPSRSVATTPSLMFRKVVARCCSVSRSARSA